MFQGFPEETVRFFLELRFHNETRWFHEHHEEYETYVRKPFYQLIEELSPTALEIAGDIETAPFRCLSRINRDIRFSRDKSPYRDHLWFLFRRSGEERDQSVMYWFELGPDNVTWGLGFWGPNRPAMDVIRSRILLHPAQVEEAFTLARLPGKVLRICGESYRKLTPSQELSPLLGQLYPMKEIYIQRAQYPFQNVFTPKLVKAIASDMKQLKPVYTLLRSAADEAKATPDA